MSGKYEHRIDYGNVVRALVFALIVLVFMNTGAFAAPHLTVLNVKYEPYPAEAGKDLDVWIKVVNDGNEEAVNVSCSVVEQFPFSVLPGEQKSCTVGDLLPGKEALMQFRLRVDELASDGWNELKIRCTASGGAIWKEEKLRIYVESKQSEFVITKLSTVPSKLLPDSEENLLEVEITNVGDAPAYGVVATLILPDGFEPSHSYSNVAGLGEIKEGDSATASFYVDIDEGVKSGNYNATLLIKYVERSGGKSVKREIRLPLIIELPPYPEVVLESYSVQPDQVVQGGDGRLVLKVVNRGEEKAESVSVRLVKSALVPISLDNRYDYIGTLEPQAEGTAVFTLSADRNAQPKSYQLKVEIRYLAGDDVVVREEYVNVNVAEARNIMVRRAVLVAIMGVIALILVYLYRRRKG